MAIEGQVAPQKVVYNEVAAMAAWAVGTQSKQFPDIKSLPQHSIAIALVGAATGVVSVRARPAGAQGFTKIGIEAVDLAAANLLCWSVTGFFDAFAVITSTIVAAGTAQCTVNSCSNGL